MNKRNKGITLLALAITIIVLLILAGVSMVIANHFIIDKAIIASNNTIEAMLKEKIEMALMDIKASYMMEQQNGSSVEKEEYIRSKLEKVEGIDKITVTLLNDSIKISISYQNNTYDFIASQEDVELLQTLKGNVKIGDYIEYPIEYTDVCSGENYTQTNGWRVIDDGTMSGTSSSVRIISTGVPVKWHYDQTEYESNQSAIEDLKNNFENLDLLNDYNDWIELKGSHFKDTSVATKITTISLEDINHVYNKLYKTNRKLNDTTLLKDKYEIFDLKSKEVFSYWIASAKENSTEKIYFISNQGIQEDSHVRMGVRPVIHLKNNLKGTFNSGVWKIIGEEK